MESAADAGGEGLVYRDSLIYRRGSNGTLSLESASFGTGRLTPSGVRYHVTDHLGSVMAVVDGTTLFDVHDTVSPLRHSHRVYRPDGFYAKIAECFCRDAESYLLRRAEVGDQKIGVHTV